MAEGQSSSFWTSIPGILTGVAALLTAVVGLLAFLAQRNHSEPDTVPTLTVQTAVLPPDRQTEFASHRVTVRVTAPSDELAKIDRVVYLLPPSFGTDAFTSSSAEDGFAMSLDASGGFLLQAKVYLSNGKVKDVSKQINLPGR